MLAQLCESCGNATSQHLELLPIFSEDLETRKLICIQCYNKSRTCAGCTQGEICPFQQDNSGIQKIVMKQVRNGNSIFQTTVKNPSLVEKTCKTNCKCWDPNLNACMKEEYGFCNNKVYKSIY